MTAKKRRRRKRAAKPAQPRVHGTATTTLDAIKWTGWAFFIIGVLGTTAGLATIPFLGYAPKNPWAEGSLNFAFPGLSVPFACALVHGILSSSWVTAEGNWHTALPRKQNLVRLAATVPFGALALVLLGLGAIPLLQFVPYDTNIGDIIGAAMIGLVLFAIVVSAVVGGMVIAGWRGGIVGLVFTLGFIALAFGLQNDNSLWTTLGVVGLAFSIVAFYFIGARTGVLPPSFRTRYGTWVAIISGVFLMAWGAIARDFWILAVGVFTIAAWGGIQLALTRTAPHRTTQQQTSLQAQKSDPNSASDTHESAQVSDDN